MIRNFVLFASIETWMLKAVLIVGAFSLMEVVHIELPNEA
jgi:hypothetical protein